MFAVRVRPLVSAVPPAVPATYSTTCGTTAACGRTSCRVGFCAAAPTHPPLHQPVHHRCIGAPFHAMQSTRPPCLRGTGTSVRDRGARRNGRHPPQPGPGRVIRVTVRSPEPSAVQGGRPCAGHATPLRGGRHRAGPWRAARPHCGHRRHRPPLAPRRLLNDLHGAHSAPHALLRIAPPACMRAVPIHTASPWWMPPHTRSASCACLRLPCMQ